MLFCFLANHDGSMNRGPADCKPPEFASQPLGLSSVLLVLLTAALWGATPVAASYSLDSLPSFTVSGIRFGLAAVFMVAWCLIEKSHLIPRRGQWKFGIIAGLMLFVQISLFTFGVEYSNSSHTTLLINTYVFWVVLFEHFVSRTHLLNGRKLGGLFLAGIGATLVTLLPLAAPTDQVDPSDQASVFGDLLLLASGLVLAIKIMYVQHGLKRVPAGTLILWHDLVAVLFFLLAGLGWEEVSGEDFTSEAILGLLYQGLVVAGFCFAVQAMLLKKHNASQLSIFSFSTPLFGLAAASLLRSDVLSPWLLVSALLVAAGIWLTQQRPR